MYQRGSLYRLKALGQRHNMDITVEGFTSWMWRGLGFIMPFLFLGYLFELYNAYSLYVLSFSEDAEWHVMTLSILFLIIFLGNTITTILVIPQKFKEKVSKILHHFKLDIDKKLLYYKVLFLKISFLIDEFYLNFVTIIITY